MRKNCLFFEKQTIIDYLMGKKENGTLNLKSKDYELVVTLFIRELYEKFGFTNAIIGLPLKDECAANFPAHDILTITKLKKIMASKQITSLKPTQKNRSHKKSSERLAHEFNHFGGCSSKSFYTALGIGNNQNYESSGFPRTI
jgi:hypothetical protein